MCVSSIKTVQEELEFKKEKNIIESQNLGVLYKHINSRMSHKQGIAPLKDYYGNIVSDDAGKANILNVNFSQMCTIDDGKIPLPIIDYNNNIVPSLSSFSCINFNEHFIFKVIDKLDGNCSPGPDDFRSILLKGLKHVICYPLSILFTKMFNFGDVPNDWKKAIVKPIFKKGSASDPNNYRPISLTSVVCKVFETIIKNQLLDYLNENSLLSREQHGFLSKHSTTTNLLESLNDWTSSWDKHLVTKILYMDFEKAFNCVSVPKLLCKLERLGINGNLLLCIKSFLTGRSQCVSIATHKSAYLPIVSGVPQGSVLGPILFLLYINDLPNIFCDGIVAKLFADDLKSYNVFDYRSNPPSMQNAVDALLGWCSSWQLNLSSPKCGSLLLQGNSNFRDSETILMGNEELKTLKTVSDLGVVIDANLSFSPHINIVVGKAKQRLFLLFKAFHSRDITLFVFAFKVYILPILEYCSPIWSPHKLCDIDKLENVQRYFTKRLTGLWDVAYKQRLLKCGLFSLELRRLHIDLILCYKILNNLTCLKITDFFELETNPRTRGHNFKLRIPKCRTSLKQHFFSIRIIPAWNSLPNNLVNCDSLPFFKINVIHIDFSKFIARDFDTFIE